MTILVLTLLNILENLKPEGPRSDAANYLSSKLKCLLTERSGIRYMEDLLLIPERIKEKYLAIPTDFHN
jgi:hypothetical protein